MVLASAPTDKAGRFLVPAVYKLRIQSSSTFCRTLFAASGCDICYTKACGVGRSTMALASTLASTELHV
jgi:hypothetical protein